jgi:hypothetical protein
MQAATTKISAENTVVSAPVADKRRASAAMFARIG